MKCPKCGYNQSRKYGMRCSKCHYQFVFDPKSSASSFLSDRKFLAAINKASANDTRYFTINQLFTSLKKSGMKRGRYVLIVALGVASIVALFALPFNFTLVIIFVFAFSIFRFLNAGSLDSLSLKTLHSLVARWQASELKSNKLLTKPSLHTPPRDYAENDIYDYGVENVLIVDKELIVDLLVKNGWHAENRALVVSIQQYPNYIWKRMETLLKASKRIPIYFLHDASSEGQQLEAKFASQFPELAKDRKIFDLGISTGTLEKIKSRRWLGNKVQEGSFSVDLLTYGQLFSFLSVAIVTPQTFGQWLEKQTSIDSYSSFG